MRLLLDNYMYMDQSYQFIQEILVNFSIKDLVHY